MREREKREREREVREWTKNVEDVAKQELLAHHSVVCGVWMLCVVGLAQSEYPENGEPGRMRRMDGETGYVDGCRLVAGAPQTHGP